MHFCGSTCIYKENTVSKTFVCMYIVYLSIVNFLATLFISNLGH